VPAKNNELVLKRIYDAPVKAVWDAWTDPKQAAQWWGPRGWHITTHSKDLKPGGKWKYDMHGPNGEFFENVTVYHEVEPQARLVYDHGGSEDRPPLFRVTVTFEEKKGKTHMKMIMALPSPEALEETKKIIKHAGGNSTWDRLAEYLEERSGHEKFVINRSFHAPIATVYEMWTKPEHLSKWLPPTGFTMEYIRLDNKVGGRSFYKMTNGKDVTMFGSVTYREFSPVTRLVYDQDFRDANDKISRHPFAPLWPESMTTVVTLTDEGDGDTRVTVEWTPSSNATPAEIDAFKKERGGMTVGWTGSFDKLEALL
jgi:uncharacterized protein YndB with AHSA1/START domain